MKIVEHPGALELCTASDPDDSEKFIMVVYRVMLHDPGSSGTQYRNKQASPPGDLERLRTP